MVARGAGVRRIAALAVVATLALSVGIAQAGEDNVKASNYSFNPATVTVHKGDKVSWTWVNGRHTVTFKQGSFDKVLSKANPSLSRRFRHRGTFRYYCRFHRSLGMKGKIVVK